MTRRALYWIPVLGIMAFIALSSHLALPPEAAPRFFRFKGSDKVVHFIVFGALGYFWARAWREERGLRLSSAIFWAVICTAVYGALDEFHQSFIPTRDCSLYDWMADVGGGLAAQAAYWLKSRPK